MSWRRITNVNKCPVICDLYSLLVEACQMSEIILCFSILQQKKTMPKDKEVLAFGGSPYNANHDGLITQRVLIGQPGEGIKM